LSFWFSTVFFFNRCASHSPRSFFTRGVGSLAVGPSRGTNPCAGRLSVPSTFFPSPCCSTCGLQRLHISASQCFRRMRGTRHPASLILEPHKPAVVFLSFSTLPFFCRGHPSSIVTRPRSTLPPFCLLANLVSIVLLFPPIAHQCPSIPPLLALLAPFFSDPFCVFLSSAPPRSGIDPHGWSFDAPPVRSFAQFPDNFFIRVPCSLVSSVRLFGFTVDRFLPPLASSVFAVFLRLPFPPWLRVCFPPY